jgi:hypothetical protein
MNLETKGNSGAAEQKRCSHNQPNANMAIVLRIPVTRIPEVIDFIESIPQARVIHQVITIGKLRIIREREPEELIQ